MNWLADQSIRVAALILVIGAGSLIARRASAHSRLFAWSVVLYLAAAMPLLGGVLPDVPVLFSEPVIVVAERDAVVGKESRQAGKTVRASQSASSLPGLPWLLAIYLTGTGLLIARLVAGTRLTARVIRRAQTVDDAALVTEVQTLSSAMGLKRVPQVLQHASVHVPFVCGVSRPALVVPDGWSSWDANTRQAVLTHELSHIVRRDLWTMRVALVYCAATWINPMSWWLRRKLETLAERASDDEVLASGVEPTAYAEMLVQFFDAAQRAPGRASWQLAMARRSGVEAGRRVGRVLSAREGGNVRFGIASRVLVGMAVVLGAVPVIALSVGDSGVVAIQAPAAIGFGLETQAELRAERRETQAELRTVVPSQRTIKRTPGAIRLMKPEPSSAVEVPAIAQQEQEPEPWRSTRKAPGADVTFPTVTYQVNPKYTSDALRAKIQGWATVEIIVSAEGYVTDARVTRSLDTVYGLDEEALKAARQWTFRPGTYQGQPTAVRVIIEMEFRLNRRTYGLSIEPR